MKKRKRPASRAKAKEGEAPDETEEEETPHPGTPRVMVTWHGPSEGGETRPEAKVWHGTRFEPGKPVSVEHLNWRSICADIDAGGPEWSYEYVVEPPPAPPVEQPAKAKEEEPTERSRSRR